jgi:hypothetical protein|tara:strand:- start:3324 stop:4604 length:1281 start_codon:yes stop_codon:yes gene_type:complete
MGGAAGHMRHPYDLQNVQSGADLIGIFEDLKSYAMTSAQDINVKIDGINVSFKLVDGEFAVDRGSNKPIDVMGVTLSRVTERFGPGHGMIPAITNLLTILNNALPDISEEINALGLTTNEHFFLNTEYVLGTTNATTYNNNFIAIHGVNAFYAKYKKVTKKMLKVDPNAKPILIRPGLPSSGKNSVEVNYNQSAMSSLIAKLKIYASKLGFDVYGPIPTAAKQDTVIDYSGALNTPFEVNISDDYSDEYGQFEHLQGRPIKDWLSEITQKPANYNGKTYDTAYRTTDGKKINPYHKITYLRILSRKEPVDSFIVADDAGDDVRQVINGSVILHATRLLGGSFLTGLTSDVGDMISDDASHEGVVIRDPQFSKYPFKITGEFIVAGMYGVISQKIAKPVVKETSIRKMVRESITRTMLTMLPRHDRQ